MLLARYGLSLQFLLSFRWMTKPFVKKDIKMLIITFKKSKLYMKKILDLG